MTSALTDSADKRPELPEFDESLPCPKCTSFTRVGFGLAGGGYGPYTYCAECSTVVSKTQEEDFDS